MDRADTAQPLSEELIRGLAECLDRESLLALAEFRLPSKAQARLDELADRANEGTITPVERQEYEAFISASEFLGLAQLRARAKLGLPLPM
jgi:hypothetical protein